MLNYGRDFSPNRWQKYDKCLEQQNKSQPFFNKARLFLGRGGLFGNKGALLRNKDGVLEKGGFFPTYCNIDFVAFSKLNALAILHIALHELFMEVGVDRN